MSGSIDMIVFTETYKKLQDKEKLEVPVLVKAGVRIEEGANPKITAAEISPLEEVKVPLPKALRIRLPLETAGAGAVDDLHALFVERKGDARFLFYVERQGDFMLEMAGAGYNVLPDRHVITQVV